MLKIVLSHWTIYFYLGYLIILSIYCFIDRDRSAGSKETRQVCSSLTTERGVAVERIVGCRRVGNSVPPEGYQYGQSLRNRAGRRRAGGPSP